MYVSNCSWKNKQITKKILLIESKYMNNTKLFRVSKQNIQYI